MKYYILLGLAVSCLLFSDQITPVFDQINDQKEKVLQLLEKENKSLEAVIEELTDLDFIQKIIEKKKKDQLKICILTKNIKTNKKAIELLKENQIEVVFFEGKNFSANLSFMIMESNQIVWIGTKYIFKKNLRNKIDPQSLMINDKQTTENFASYFAKIKEKLR